jgi:hypothetical protein
VNASSSSIGRDAEVQSKIRKVRTFGRAARTLSGALFGFGLVGSVMILIVVAIGPLAKPLGGFVVHALGAITTAELATPALRAWGFLASGALMGVSLAFVYQHYRLFGNLADGAIYTSENVRRVRNVGILALLAAAVEILIPVASSALVASGFIEASVPINLEPGFSSQTASAMISAGLLLLASWIMDVGLSEKDHADALQRDADLVI